MRARQFPEIQNIHSIMMPFQESYDIISANVFALGKDPVTLIDTGPKIPGSMELIKKELAQAGLNIEDIERIIITHGHTDHFGLAARIQEAAGHPIDFFIHKDDAWRVSTANMKDESWNKGLADLKSMTGMPQSELEGIKRNVSSFNAMCDPLEDISTMDDGDEFAGEGYHLKVIHTPGHSPGNCCLYESTHKILFSGDHILKHVTPNPFIEIRREWLRDPGYQSLRAYRESLDKIVGIDVNFVFPGHGEYLTDLQGVIAGNREHQRERMNLVWSAIRNAQRPLYYMVGDIFPNMPEGDLLLAISEIIAHLEILINEGRAELIDAAPPNLYRAL